MQDIPEEFVERLSLHLENYGFSRIAGRMFGYFLIHGGTRPLDELAEALQVSKGSVSTNARFLESRGILRRCGRPGDRRDFYCLADDPRRKMFDVAQERMRDMSSLFAEGAQKLPDGLGEAQERLARWSDFYAFIVRDIGDSIEQWETRDASARQAEPLEDPAA